LRESVDITEPGRPGRFRRRAGLGAAVLGALADHTSITFVYHVCSFLPALGLLAAFLPNLEPHKTKPRADEPHLLEA